MAKTTKTKIALTDVPSSADALHRAYETRAATAAPMSRDDWRRNHLGASLLGHECDRFLWLTFRWALDPKIPGRMLRLFARGDHEEEWIVRDLRAAGFDVQDRDPATGEQWRVKFLSGHIGGGLDGIVTGLLEAPKTPHVLEIKTHNLKQWTELHRVGVKRSHEKHYVQGQIYMLGRQLERTYYVGVCKDNDKIHAERFELDRPFAQAAVDRGQAIVDAEEPADRLDKDNPPCVYTTREGDRFECPFYRQCHGEALAEKNCRTCVSATTMHDGTWHCSLHDKVLLPDEQRKGCPQHLTIPPILNMQVAQVDDERRRITYRTAAGKLVVDGEAQ